MSDDNLSSKLDFHFISTEYHKSIYNLHSEIIERDSLIKIEQDDLKAENQQLKEKLKNQENDFKQCIDELKNQINQMDQLIKQQRKEIDELKKPVIKCQFINESYPLGITAYLKGKVNLSAGGYLGEKYPLCNILDFDTSFFCNYVYQKSYVSNENSCFIEFDFGPSYKVDISSYFIQSNDSGPSKHHHPKSWKINGSNDRENWTLLDSRENNSNLNGSLKKFNFVCQEGKYGNPDSRFRYIRYIQSNAWFDHQYAIKITYFELYGDIYTI